ncbi:MAG: peptide deformylase, partial [Caldithrix sp.]|nr:peptide deformylase [Caldithrix sp.]
MYRIRYIGDPILREKTKAVKNFDDHLIRTVDNMIKTMHTEDGVGLAAPQVGLTERILVVDISPLEEEEKPQTYINTEILEYWGQST